MPFTAIHMRAASRVAACQEGCHERDVEGAQAAGSLKSFMLLILSRLRNCPEMYQRK
jgi:hypothetical protein